jgi:hypothetical protein
MDISSHGSPSFSPYQVEQAEKPHFLQKKQPASGIRAAPQSGQKFEFLLVSIFSMPYLCNANNNIVK